jgi:hypothetical protein
VREDRLREVLLLRDVRVDAGIAAAHLRLLRGMGRRYDPSGKGGKSVEDVHRRARVLPADPDRRAARAG